MKSDFIPIVAVLKSNEKLRDSCRVIEIKSNQLEVSLEYFFPKYYPGATREHMVTCFYIGDIVYNVHVTYIFSEEEKIEFN